MPRRDTIVPSQSAIRKVQGGERSFANAHGVYIRRSIIRPCQRATSASGLRRRPIMTTRSSMRWRKPWSCWEELRLPLTPRSTRNDFQSIPKLLRRRRGSLFARHRMHASFSSPTTMDLTLILIGL